MDVINFIPTSQAIEKIMDLSSFSLKLRIPSFLFKKFYVGSLSRNT